jgi:hypothetical protein
MTNQQQIEKYSNNDKHGNKYETRIDERINNCTQIQTARKNSHKN